MVNLISFPFRLASTGAVQTREDGTDEYYAEQLAVLTLTRPGERDLVPDFGITDPTYGTFNEAELIAKVDMFGPPVKIKNIVTNVVREGVMNVLVSFEDSPTEHGFIADAESETETINAII